MFLKLRFKVKIGLLHSLVYCTRLSYTLYLLWVQANACTLRMEDQARPDHVTW